MQSPLIYIFGGFMFFAISFILGVFLSGFFNKTIEAITFIVILLLCIFIKRKEISLKRLIFCFIFFIFGVSYFLILNNIIDKNFSDINDINKCRILVVSDVKENNNMLTFEGKIVDYKAKANVIIYSEIYPKIGYRDIIEVNNAKITSIKDEETGYSFSLKDYLYSKGIYLKLTADSSDIVSVKEAHRFNLLRILNNFKNYTNGVLYKYFDNEPYMLLSGILTGNNDFKNKEFEEMLLKTGLTHVVVVSGMHFSIIVMLLSVLLSRLRIGRKTISFISIIFAVVLAIFIGLTPSVTRALIMVIILSLADILERDKKTTVHLLSITALIMILYNPNLIYNVGFILSFASVLGILLLSNKIIIHKIPKSINDIISVSISANIFTIPFTLHYFSSISLNFILGNLIITPILPFVMLYSFFVLISGSINVMYGYYCAVPLNYSVNILIRIIKFISKIPFTFFNIIAIEKIWILIYCFNLYILFNIKKTKTKVILSLILFFILILNPLAEIYKNKAQINYLNNYDSGKVFLFYKNKSYFIDLSSSNGKYSYDKFIKSKFAGVIDNYIISDESKVDFLYNISKDFKIKNIYYPLYIDNIEYYKERLLNTGSVLVPISDTYYLKSSELILTLMTDERYNINNINIHCNNKDLKILSDMNYSLKDYEQYIVSYNLYKILKLNNLLYKYKILNDLSNDNKGMVL